ncbi:MAG TPA: FmdB family zinc ribbon protein [Thermoanaerobaculia bacterium]
MPLYEYACEKCGERVEVIQKFSDPPYTHCPNCGGNMRKLISLSAIQFKGSGFYKTDYGSSGSSSMKTAGSEAKKSEPAAETKSEARTESKTDSKTDSKSKD